MADIFLNAITSALLVAAVLIGIFIPVLKIGSFEEAKYVFSTPVSNIMIAEAK